MTDKTEGHTPLPCPVCKGTMIYEPHDPKEWAAAPEHYDCPHCGTIVQSNGVKILRKLSTSESVSLEEINRSIDAYNAKIDRVLLPLCEQPTIAVNERPALLERLKRCEEALRMLDSVLDFSVPASEDKPWIFEDWSGINSAFEAARAALKAE